MESMMSENDKAKKTKKKKKVAKKKETPKRTPEELMTDAKAFVKAHASPDYERIKEVIEATPNGRPARVVIVCADPQMNGSGDSVCEKTREIAIQDLHQVQRCVPCQKRSVQTYRNRLAQKRRQELAKHRVDKKTKMKSKK